jgi:hypothetical protein
MQYQYTISPFSSDRLTQEIRISAIQTALDYITSFGTSVSIYFKADLSSGDVEILNTIVSNHSGLPVVENITQKVEVTKQAEPQPFAVPAYRTKMNATGGIVTVAPGTDSDIQFQMTAERYVTGGSIVVKNAQIGDYIVAEVEDPDGVIPSPYRTALCEAWPVVSTYIEKRFIEINGDITIDGNTTTMKINTYPLTGKISAGLYLCVHYYAVNSGYDRVLAVNYDLTKKL